MPCRFQVGDVIAEQIGGSIKHVEKVEVLQIISDNLVVVSHHRRQMNWSIYGGDQAALQWPARPCALVPCTTCGGDINMLLAEAPQTVRILEEDD